MSETVEPIEDGPFSFKPIISPLENKLMWMLFAIPIAVYFEFSGQHAYAFFASMAAIMPLAWLMGIQWAECSIAGELLGYKLFANEFIAYQNLSQIQGSADTALSDRTTVILTYALCGFANFGSIGIQLAGIGGIAPSRRSDLAKLAVRAMLGGTLAAFMTGCFAGMLYGVPWDIISW